MTGDGKIGIDDVTELIDLLLSGNVTGNDAADFNTDGHVGIDDATELIDQLLSGKL